MNILLAGNYNYSKEQIEFLKKMKLNIYLMTNEEESLPLNAESIDMVVCNWLFKYHSIQKFKNLKYIQLLSAGLERVPLEYINKNQIVLKNAKDVYSIPMAEFAICGILQLIKKSKFFLKNQEKKIWEKNRNLLELSEKNVAIIGMGSIGSEIAKRIEGFVKEVVGFDKKNIESKYKIYPINDLDMSIAKYDILIFTVPITKETIHLLNMSRVEKMNKGTIVVNVSRGGVIDERALLYGIEKGKIFGAVLDVFEEEPLVKDEIWENENIIVTPHNSFVSDLNHERMWKVIFNNIEEYVQKR